MKIKTILGAPDLLSPVLQSKFFRSTGALGRWGTLMCLLIFITAQGCKSTKGNTGWVNQYPGQSMEAQWIRNGDPIEYENDLWYPADGTENFLDTEVLKLGEFQKVEFFADKVDVRPYGRIYTKFDRNKFRFYEKRIEE